MRLPVGCLLLVVAACLPSTARAACAPPRAPAAYTASVDRALRAGQDVWGNALLRAPGGPTYAGAKRYLAPLLYARTSKGRPLTASGVHYVPFGMPLGAYGAGSVALHLADGSEIRRERADGPRLAVTVNGRPFAACGAAATLLDGWLPVLRTRANGVAQESFSVRIGETLTTFVRVDAPAAARVRIGGVATRIAAWDGRRVRAVGDDEYGGARDALATYWRARLDEGALFVVPEKRVLDAERALLVQNLSLTWRYSIGNPYEEFSFPESVDQAQVLAEYGHAAVAATVLRTSLSRRPEPYANWKRGEKLLGAAVLWRLGRDPAFVARVTPTLASYVTALSRSLGENGLLARERYSSDIPDQVYGLHAQAVVWQGLREAAAMWAATGRPALAARARSVAARLEPGLRRAVRASERRLRDGSLFVPVNLLGGERPYRSITESRDGSYWNLVMPYALASGLFPPGSREARGILRYMQLHGSRLLGLVRAGAFALYASPRFPTGGTDQVYGLNMARFLADAHEPEQLVLQLYGQLAAGMTPSTFVAGEGATVAPLDGRWFRAMYLPPNATSNGAFLETLRQQLVHETPAGLELAYATPRAWLAPGKRIEVRAAPTRFGPLSYALEATAGGVHVSLDVPPRAQRISLRLRLPHATRTVDLSGRSGRVELDVATAARAPSRALSSATVAAKEPAHPPRVKRLKIFYRAHNGSRRAAWVVLPQWYGPRNHPPLPLVISPHGRGLTGRQNAQLWGTLPADGPFVVVNPDGQGRLFARYSWGSPGQIADLARMPRIVTHALPWLNVDRSQIYAFGGSMGGQETLLLLARHPKLLAGVAVFDSVVDLKMQYHAFPRLHCGSGCRHTYAGHIGATLQHLARQEIGGPPARYPGAWARRSPLTYVRRVARSCVPLQVWWSTADRIVRDQQLQSGRFFWTVKRLNPVAPIEGYVGLWIHSAEMKAKLPYALARFGLLPPTFQVKTPALHIEEPPLSPDC